MSALLAYVTQAMAAHRRARRREQTPHIDTLLMIGYINSALPPDDARIYHDTLAIQVIPSSDGDTYFCVDYAPEDSPEKAELAFEAYIYGQPSGPSGRSIDTQCHTISVPWSRWHGLLEAWFNEVRAQAAVASAVVTQ